MQVTTSTTDVLTPTAIALGNFDGLHLGHQQVLHPIISRQKESNSSVYATVVTFNPHPQEFFSGESRQLLTPLAEKTQILEQWDIKQLVLLPFDRELASLSPEQFVEEIIVRQLQAKQISVGQDFRFGYKRQGNAEKLQSLAALWGISVYITPLKTGESSVRISSSLIRQALAKGDIVQAKEMLGRSYAILGKVIKGQQLGRKIGFPTANIEFSPDKLLPRYGVYGGWMTIETESDPILGAINIGNRPTVKGDAPTVEVHLLDWQGDLYNREVKVSLETFIRPEQRFSSLDELKSQIKQDCQCIRQILLDRL